MYHAHYTPRNIKIKKRTNDNSPMIIPPHHHLLHSFESNSNFTGDWAADVSCIHTCVHCWTFLQCSGSHCTTVLFSRGQCITLHRDSEGIGLIYHVHTVGLYHCTFFHFISIYSVFHLIGIQRGLG